MTTYKKRVQFAVTRDPDKAKARYPWAKSWVQIKSGVWCFEDPEDARRYMPGQDREFTPGPKRLNKKFDTTTVREV